MFAKKQCTSNGTWWGPSSHEGEFTDYGECSNMWRGLVRQYVNIGCNGVSSMWGKVSSDRDVPSSQLRYSRGRRQVLGTYTYGEQALDIVS